MKLPNFQDHPLLNQLRSDMGAQIVKVPSRARSRLLNPEAVMALGRPAPSSVAMKSGTVAPNAPSQYARNAGSRVLTPIRDKESSS
ncbi:MAG: hypothetical protein RJA77_1077 [Pseudomonadota bacterium]|jgi:hypothetical protein